MYKYMLTLSLLKFLIKESI